MQGFYPLYVSAMLENPSQEPGVGKLRLYDSANGAYGSLRLFDGAIEFRDTGGLPIFVGSSVSVRDIDGNPSIAATTIEFTNGTVTNQGSGVARVTIAGGGTPTAITVDSEAADVSCFPAFFTSKNGDLAPKTNEGLLYNSATNALTATTFVGALTGTASGNAASSHAHGNITNAGAIGSTANLPIITTTSGVLTVATFTGTGTIFVASVSPDFTGNPTATTQATTDKSTRIATTAFVKTAIPAQLELAIDTTTTGLKLPFHRVPYNCTITRWELVGDVSGDVVIDLWKDTYPNLLPTVSASITASAKPTLSSALKATSTTLTGWTTTLAAGDYIGANVDSRATITVATLVLFLTRT